MTLRSNTLEGGTNGTTLTQAVGGNTGGASGDYFDTIVIGGTSLTFDNTFGGLAMKVVNATPVATYAAWSTQLGTLPAAYYGRAYFATGAFPPTISTILRPYNGATAVMKFRLDTTGKLRLSDSAGTTDWALGTSVLPTNTLVRLEWFLDHTNTQAILRYYSDPTSTGTPTETLDSGTGKTFGAASTTEFRFGMSDAYTAWYDNVQADSGGWPGPLTALTYPRSFNPIPFQGKGRNL